MFNFTVLEILFLMITFSAFSYYINRKYMRLPDAVGMTIVSMLIVTVSHYFAYNLNLIDLIKFENHLKEFNFYDFLLNGVLLFLLFASAIKFEITNLKKWWWQITTLATLGVVISTFIIGSLVYGFVYLLLLIGGEFYIPYIYCLLLGAILSPTDPPAAIAVFKEMANKGTPAPQHIEVKLLGESLFNDGMGIVLFLTILGVITGKSELTVSSVSISLITEIVGAIILGLVFGIVYRFFLKHIHEFTGIALFTLSLAIGTYIRANILHFSAPIAVVVAGLMIGQNIKKIYDEEQIHHLHLFWNFIDEVLNASLFALIGIVVLIIDFNWILVSLGVITFLCTLFGRYLSIASSFFYPNKKGKVLNGSINIISYGGIRGGISLALALSVLQIGNGSNNSNVVASSLESLAIGNSLVAITFITVVLSNLIQGMTFKYVIQAYYPNSESKNYNGINKVLQKSFNWLFKVKYQETVELTTNIISSDNKKINEKNVDNVVKETNNSNYAIKENRNHLNIEIENDEHQLSNDINISYNLDEISNTNKKDTVISNNSYDNRDTIIKSEKTDDELEHRLAYPVDEITDEKF